jgi:hypothetical protein
MAGFSEVGDTERLTIAIRDTAGVLTNPVTLRLTVETPSGVRTVDAPSDPDIVSDGVGQFHRDVLLTEAGTWAYEWATTVPDQVQGGRIVVRSSPLGAIPRSLSLEALKRRVDHKMEVDEDLLADDLVSAFMQAQRPWPFGTGRLLAPDPPHDSDAAVTRTVVTTRRRVRVPDARQIDSVTLDGVAVTGYGARSHDDLVVQLALADDGAWTAHGGNVSGDAAGYLGYDPMGRTVVVTGRFGFARIPEDLAGAIYQLAARWHYERQAQYADQVEILEGAAVQAYFRQLPPRVKLVFQSYALPAGIGGLR